MPRLQVVGAKEGNAAFIYRCELTLRLAHDLLIKIVRGKQDGQMLFRHILPERIVAIQYARDIGLN